MAPADSATIAADLRALIVNGDIEPGEKLPGELELTEKYGVARMTVRAAYATLLHEGLTEPRKGAGVYVRREARKVRRHGTERYARSRWRTAPLLGAEAGAQGLTVRREIRALATVPAPAVVAERLAICEGEPVWTRQRLVWVEERPSQTADSYYPLDVGTGTRLRETEGGGSDFAQLENAGHTPSRIQEEWAARMPTPAETQQLRMLPGTPVLDFVRTIFDQNDRPVEVMLSLIAADTAIMSYDFPVPD